jgi:hypothetical protein
MINCERPPSPSFPQPDESGFDVLIAFNSEAHTAEVSELGSVPVLTTRMNADLHMADELRKADKANMFVGAGEHRSAFAWAGFSRP